MKIVEKPWGREIWIAHKNGLYVGKRLEINQGAKFSLQKHNKKHETLFLDKGVAAITIGEDFKVYLRADNYSYANRTFVIPPGTIHRVEAITNVVLYEFSTNHLDDVVRPEDDYRRV